MNNEDQIEITNRTQSEKYGEWAIANIFIGNQYVRDVFVTPLAMNAYNKRDDNSYILVQFVDETKYMNVVFYGGLTECMVVKKCPNAILPRDIFNYNIDACTTGPGKFWHKR